MLFYDRPGYGKPQAISAFFSHPRFVCAVKPFEDMLLIGRRDRLSRIIDGQHRVMGGGLQGDGDRSADAGVFAGIVQKDCNHLFDLGLAAADVDAGNDVIV